VLRWDFRATLAHCVKHRIPLICEFHKMHHGADVQRRSPRSAATRAD
jgi:sterol desaturase/sphingolipid hydroxylase (fatty acid hydroxylase superfamily)